MTTELPNYVAVAPNECGKSFGLSVADYRMLAVTALDVTREVEAAMSMYKLPDSAGCALDVVSDDCCLTIQVNSALEQITLWRADLDSPTGPLCVLSVGNTEDDWRRLSQMARKAL
jgi:hypothetical protein